MRLAKVRIENFRAHADTTLPLSQFGCLIGENNAGKSSVLHALQFAIEGGKLGAADFRDPALAVRVTVWFEEVGDADLARIGNAEQRERVSEMAHGGRLTLLRSMVLHARPELQYLARVPKDSRWDSADFNAAIAKKSGAPLRAAAVAALPELDAVLADKPTAAAVREQREILIAQLPEADLVESPAAVKTGIPASLTALLPEVIYIEAVKDATAETKTTDSATFGRLLRLLLLEVEDQFADITEQFLTVQRKLSRVLEDDGEVTDVRLEPVRLIESTIEKFVQESFPSVALKMDVPAPTLSTILGGAQLHVDDGHEGTLASKGDGLKRTVLFAILRAYTALRAQGLGPASSAASEASYLLLFEEPELYLHPRAQRQLMNTLTQFAETHPVLVTTHSPSFFGPTTTGFAKLQRLEDGVHAYPVELDLSARDAYQLVHHENNEAAFFARSVVLVEGDSDVFTFPHLAKLLDPEWDHDELNIMFVKTGGKGSISRYRSFFGMFGVPIHVITDLDSLVDGFQHLTDAPELTRQHAALMSDVAKLVDATQVPNSRKVNEIVERRNASALWAAAQGEFAQWSATPSPEAAQQVTSTLEQLFDLGRRGSKTSLLQNAEASIASSRDALIAALAAKRVHVLRRGDLESYYGDAKGRGDKVTRAIEFCRDTGTLAQFAARHGDDAPEVEAELRALFAPIYEAEDTMADASR